MACAAALLLPGQSHDIFRAIRESRDATLVVEVARLGVFLALFCTVLLSSGLLLLRACPAGRGSAVARHRRLIEALAVCLPLVPIVAVGLVTMDPDALQGMAFGWLAYDKLANGSAALVIAGAIAGLALLDPLRGAIVRGAGALLEPLSRIGSVGGLLLVAALIAVLCVVIVLAPKPVADILGPVCVVFLFFSVLCVFAALLTYAYDRYQIPGLSLLAAAAIAWAIIGSNNNHGIRIKEQSAPVPPDAAQAFKAWLQDRPDLEAFAGRSYPVYLVTAEGGGLYAAVHAAWTLGRVQDSCPAFARHLFAISGVSGGSLGAALFTSLVKAYPPPRELPADQRCPAAAIDGGRMQKVVRAYFEEDLLTPLLAAGLFPDFFQRFWPLPIGALDRARALEAGYEEAWKKVMHAAGRDDMTGVFEDNFRELWQADLDVPALLLNTTVVRSGDRAIVAPFRLRDPDFFQDPRIDVLNESRSVRLSTAVGASARFPLVTPPAFVGWAPSDVQLVDGGYYENSGLQTVMDLVGMLRRVPERLERTAGAASPTGKMACAASNMAMVETKKRGIVSVCFKLLVIRSPNGERSLPPADELLAPIIAMYEARIARGRANGLLGNRVYCGGRNCGSGSAAEFPHFYQKTIEMSGLPLGWYLSKWSLDQIMTVDYGARDCRSKGQDQSGVSQFELAKEENACLLQRISADLK